MTKEKKITIALIIALVITASSTVVMYGQLEEMKKDPQKVAQKEVEALVERVSKLIVLPVGETPTVATVTDPEKLKDQAFFVNAVIGDKVLIYTTAKKAILYNPTTNKIVDVAPLNIGSSQTPVKATQETGTTTKETN